MSASVVPSALVPLKGMRGSIARNMALAWQAPHVTIGVDVDMTAVLGTRDTLQREAPAGLRVSVTPIVLHAVVQSLVKHAPMNALLKADGIERVPHVHLGVAVALADGLAVPVIRDAQTLDALALAAANRDLVAGARAGALAPKDYQGGTFTVTNLGASGIDWFTPILNPPQVGILGVGGIVDRVVVRNGALSVAPMCTFTLVFDHRAVDGQPAAQFLATVKHSLETIGGT